MVGRFDEGVHLPDLVGRQALAERRHLRALAAIDHRFEELLIGQLGGKKVRAARAGAVMTYVAFAAVNVAAGGDRFRPPENGIPQGFLGEARCQMPEDQHEASKGA